MALAHKTKTPAPQWKQGYAFAISYPPDKTPVFWLPVHPPPALPIGLPPDSGFAGFVSGYSGGTATDSHRVPTAAHPDRFRIPKADREVKWN